MYRNSVETNVVGGITLNGFLSQWAFMTLREPQKSLAHLIYNGYPGDLTLAFRITRQPKQDRKKQRSQRVVLQCFIFGPTNVGKSALLNALIGRLYNEVYEHTKGDHYATNIVEQIGGSKKTLIMREINEESVSSLLEKRDALADCDVAAFVYDGSNAASWKCTVDLLVELAAHGEKYGFEVPCLLVAAKDDLEPDPICHQSSIQVCADMGVEAPFTVSMKLGDIGNLFRRIVDAAQRPHLSVPETEAGKSNKNYQRLVQRSLTIAAVGATVSVAGIVLYRVYHARKQQSGS